MTTLRTELARAAAALAGLCGIAAVGLTASCFSERTTGTTQNCAGTTSDPCVVEIRNFTFQPSTLRVPAGATVTWVNRDDVVHTSTSDAGVWDSPSLSTNATYSRTFGAAGQFPYHCTPHPNMQARIVVE
jgi:plastocyanin